MPIIYATDLKIWVGDPPPEKPDHDCMDHRIRRLYTEGDDHVIEACNVCMKVRYEADGIRPMAWYLSKRTPTDVRYVYAWPDPVVDDTREVWKHPDLGLWGLSLERI